MDNSIYIAANAAQGMLHAVAMTSNNLANAATTGFRSDMPIFSQVELPTYSNALDTRVFNELQGTFTNLQPGAVTTTGRELDIAIQGEGFIAVQGPDGSEAYTRLGSLKISSTGQLQTSSGYPVLGNGGPIAIPPAESLDIGSDGTISIRPAGQAASALATLDRIKLIKPNQNDLTKGTDGLMHFRTGPQTAPADPSIRVLSKAIEGSNVNAVGEMVNLIDYSRKFDMYVKFIEMAKENDEQSAQIMQINS